MNAHRPRHTRRACLAVAGLSARQVADNLLNEIRGQLNVLVADDHDRQAMHSALDALPLHDLTETVAEEATHNSTVACQYFNAWEKRSQSFERQRKDLLGWLLTEVLFVHFLPDREDTKAVALANTRFVYGLMPRPILVGILDVIKAAVADSLKATVASVFEALKQPDGTYDFRRVRTDDTAFLAISQITNRIRDLIRSGAIDQAMIAQAVETHQSEQFPHDFSDLDWAFLNDLFEDNPIRLSILLYGLRNAGASLGMRTQFLGQLGSVPCLGHLKAYLAVGLRAGAITGNDLNRIKSAATGEAQGGALSADLIEGLFTATPRELLHKPSGFELPVAPHRQDEAVSA
ncbi:MAG: hypothetical protein IT565_03425 [Rhodospirillales bacterium]|nr:hypothetical protein [Rhodospirillales bacterium]